MNLNSWFVDTITVSSVTALSVYGVPSYGAQRAVKARVESSRRIVRRANGIEAQADHRIYCGEALALSDRIWLPGADTGSAAVAKAPIAVHSNHDKSGRSTLWAVDL